MSAIHMLLELSLLALSEQEHNTRLVGLNGLVPFPLGPYRC